MRRLPGRRVTASSSVLPAFCASKRAPRSALVLQRPTQNVPAADRHSTDRNRRPATSRVDRQTMASKIVRQKVRPLIGRKPVGLALQGGGSWGAYTWGVLDALLGSRSLSIAQLSGTSAGALNAAIV